MKTLLFVLLLVLAGCGKDNTTHFTEGGCVPVTQGMLGSTALVMRDCDGNLLVVPTK